MELRHYYPSNQNLSSKIDFTKAAAWDQARDEDEHFVIPRDREVWIRKCEVPGFHDSATGDLVARAYAIIDLVGERSHPDTIISVGSGLGALEYHIKRLSPKSRVFCSDFSEETVKRLSLVFQECEGVRLFNIAAHKISDVFPDERKDSLVLMHRVDPHLSNDEWRHVFDNFHKDGVELILFVPHRFLTWKYAIRSKLREFVCRLQRRPLALSGYIRTKSDFTQMWNGLYDVLQNVYIGSASGFLLQRKS